MTLESTHQYDDIMSYPHHQSKKHRHMTHHERAAQFMPFAALRGFESAIDEIAHQMNNQNRIVLGPDEQQELNKRLIEVLGQLELQPWVTITHFIPDGHKDGGTYIVTEGIIKKFDSAQHILVMDDESTICLANIVDIQY